MSAPPTAIVATVRFVSPALFRSSGSLPQPDLLQERGPARVGVQRGQVGPRLGERDPRVARLPRALEPLERLVELAALGSNLCDLERAVVRIFALEPRQRLVRLGSPPQRPVDDRE